MKIVRDSAVRQEPAQPQAVSPEENRFSIRPRQIALFFLWMLAFTLLARGTSGALLPEVQLSTPAPNTITQSLTATGTIQWAAGSLFYLPEGLLVEAVFVSEGEAVQEEDKIAALRREDVEQKLRSLQAELAQKQTEYARLTKPVAADSYDLEKAQQALQAAYQAAENSAAAWAEKEANAGSERDCVLVHLDGIRQTPEGSPSFYATLDEAEHEFASSAFLRIHKSYLINGDHILQMSNYKVLLDTGMTLKGSRKYFSKAKLEFYRGR